MDDASSWSLGVAGRGGCARRFKYDTGASVTRDLSRVVAWERNRWWVTPRKGPNACRLFANYGI